MTGRTRQRAVDCGNYSELSNCVATGLRDLYDEEVPLLFEEDDGIGDLDSWGIGDVDILLLESLKGDRS